VIVETIGLKLALVNCFIFMMLSWILHELKISCEGMSDFGEFFGAITGDVVN